MVFRFFLVLTISIILVFNLNSQETYHPNFCGFHAGEKDIERLVANLEFAETLNFYRSSEIFYVPIKFHLIARSDGTGRVREADALNQLCIINQNFESHNIQFFLKDKSFNYINNTTAYNNPSAANTTLQSNRDSRALNVFWALETIPGENVLGYYDSQRDWVVMRNSQVNSSFTLTHEIGHFFSLMHTFFGWETEPWEEDLHGNPVTQVFSPYPWGQVRVELVDRSNCGISADRICDTPPDYGFGSRWSGCSPFTLEVFDRNNDLVEPMQNNYMSYFFGCSDYEFTPMQVNAMRADFQSPARIYLRNGYGTPETGEITVTPEPIYPLNNGISDYYDEVRLIWDDVPEASFYFLEISTSPAFSANLTSQMKVFDNELLLTDLEPNRNYFWRVKPLNESYFCAPRSQRYSFTTSDIRTSVNAFPQDDIKLNLIRNPIRKGMKASIDIENNIGHQDFLIEVFSLNGQLISSERFGFSTGNHKFSLNYNFTASGMYLISITSDNNRAILPLIVN